MKTLLPLLLLFALNSYAQTQCFETVIVPKEYEITTHSDPSYDPSPQKVIIPPEYKVETTYVEAVPAGTQPPAHVPKQYKKVETRVELPCKYEVDEEGNCYKMAVVPHTPNLITEKVEVPCFYETDKNGDCVRQVETLCVASVKCKQREAIQAALQAKGYDAGKGKADFLTKTATALTAFQKATGMDLVPWSLESLKVLEEE